jgi:hypothetical protein
MSYLKALIADPLYIRVCMVLWGGALLALGTFVSISWRPADAEWLGYGLFALLAVLGLYLVAAALVSSEERIDRACKSLSHGGDIFGLVASVLVCVFALPIVAIARVMWRRVPKEQ